jgi:hypothetical protein
MTATKKSAKKSASKPATKKISSEKQKPEHRGDPQVIVRG